MVHKQSKFVLDTRIWEVTEGKAPTKDGQLWKGEDEKGNKMEFAGNTDGSPTAYWGWSSGDMFS